MKRKTQLMVHSILTPQYFGIVLYESSSINENKILSWLKMISNYKPEFVETALLHANRAYDTLYE